MATPMLRRLKEKEPGARVTVIGLGDHRALFEGSPHVDDLMFYSSLKGAGNFIRVASKIRTGGFDRGYILPNSLSSASLFALGRVREKTGYHTEARGLFLDRRVPWPGQVEHRVIRYLRLLENVPDLERIARDYRVEIFLGEEDRARAEELLENVNTEKAIALNPCSITPTRRWFPERFAEVADRAQQELGLETVLVGGPSDEDARTASAVMELSNTAKITNLAGKTHIKSLSTVLGRLRLLVTGNTGTMHVASTAGIPMVLLPGSSDIVITAPWGVEFRVIHKELECYPCWKNECPENTDRPECMTAITVDDVMREVAGILK